MDLHFARTLDLYGYRHEGRRPNSRSHRLGMARRSSRYTWSGNRRQRTDAVCTRHAKRRFVHSHHLSGPETEFRLQRSHLLVGRRLISAARIRPSQCLHFASGTKPTTATNHSKHLRPNDHEQSLSRLRLDVHQRHCDHASRIEDNVVH